MRLNLSGLEGSPIHLLCRRSIRLEVLKPHLPGYEKTAESFPRIRSGKRA